MNKKLKVVFQPGAFDSFEGSQEELDELIKGIEQMIQDGTLEENSQPVDLDQLEQEDPELAKLLRERIDDIDNQSDRKLN